MVEGGAEERTGERTGRGPWLRADWPAPPRVRALCTTRGLAEGWGSSGGAYARLNLGTGVGDEAAAVAANRARLRRALGLPLEPAWLRQVHGARVVPARPGGGQEADGSWTARPGLACAVLMADCLPVLLCDRVGTRVAAVHAGWRGLAAGVLEAAVAALGLPGRELLAWLGPAIGPDAFEVGPEVRAAFLGRDPGAEACFRPHPEGSRGDRWLADLPGLARRRLTVLGVTQVYGGRWCTWSEPERFYSHRRGGGRAGRQAALVWLEPGAGAAGGGLAPAGGSR